MRPILPQAAFAGRRRRDNWTPYLFVLPYLVVFTLFRLGPSLAGLGISFTRWNLVGTPRWIGVENHLVLFHDPRVVIALRNTVAFTALVVPLLVALGLALALFLNRPYRGRVIGRIAVFTPYVMMSTVVGILWTWLLERDFGLLNSYLAGLGIPRTPWLISESTALFGLAITTVWWTVGYGMVLFLAGLQDIPAEVYEAASIDGATSLGAFRHITLPFLAPTTFVVFLLSIINSFQVFDQAYVMTSGGPGTATLTLVQLLYFIGFQSFKMGYAAAIASLMFVILVVFTLFLTRAFHSGMKGVGT